VKTGAKCEEKILAELRDVPPSELPKVLRLIHLLKEEFLSAEGGPDEQSYQEGKKILLDLGKGLGEGPEDLARDHDRYLY
jgi:hypothetical protein